MKKHFEGLSKAKIKENAKPKSSRDLYILIQVHRLSDVKNKTTGTQLCLLPFDTSYILYSSGSQTLKCCESFLNPLEKTDSLTSTTKDSDSVHLSWNMEIWHWDVWFSEQGVFGPYFKEHNSIFCDLPHHHPPPQKKIGV